MHILEFPPEILDNILYYSIISRGLPRALRLKLVCKSFYTTFRPVLFATKALDNFGNRENFRHWHIRKYHGADILWHDYLVFRCRNETDESVGRFVEIRNVANAFLQHCEARGEDPGADFDTILDGLCWLALERGSKRPGQRWGWDSHTGRNGELFDLGLNLLSAGTYFGCISLVRDLLCQGFDPIKDNDLFPAAMYLAAWTGRADILQLMQEHLPDFENCEINKYGIDFRSKIGPGSLFGAAASGNLDMVRLALYPPSRTIPSLRDNIDNDGEKSEEREPVHNSMLVLGEKPGSVPVDSKLGKYIAQGMGRTRSPEIFQYLRSFNPALANQKFMNNNLAEMAGAGDIVMVRHLMEMGANPAAKETGLRTGGTPLAHAIRAVHEDVVDLMLEQGCDPNERGRYRHGTPLTAAAKAGSMTMLRKLLDAGAKIAKQDVHTLKHAVDVEHTAMVELLLRMGAGSEKERGRVLKMAQDAGLESMTNILKSYEANVGD